MTGHESEVRRWLSDPNPAKRTHAAERLKYPFPPEFVPPPAPEPPVPPTLPPHLEALLAPEPWEDLAWLRRWALAGSDPEADVRAYANRQATIESWAGPPIAGWLHVAVMGDVWSSILRELLSISWRSGLAGASASVNLCVVYEPGREREDLSWLPPWVKVVKTGGPFEMGENSTLEALQEWSKGNPREKVWYAHTKGASRPGDRNVLAWRDFLAYFNTLRWRDCAAAIDSHDLAGVDWATRGDQDWFELLWGPGHPKGSGFVGNFWWARADYLATLPTDRVRLDRDRWDAEWSFVGAGTPRVKMFHDARSNHYNAPYPRSAYEPVARRAAKPRVPLGVRPEPAPPPGRR